MVICPGVFHNHLSRGNAPRSHLKTSRVRAFKWYFEKGQIPSGHQVVPEHPLVSISRCPFLQCLCASNKTANFGASGINEAFPSNISPQTFGFTVSRKRVPHRFWSRWIPWLSSKLNQAASGYLFKVFLGHEFCHLGCDWNQTPTGNGLGWPLYGCLSDIQYLACVVIENPKSATVYFDAIQWLRSLGTLRATRGH